MTVFLTFIDRTAAGQDADFKGAERTTSMVERTGRWYRSFLGSLVVYPIADAEVTAVCDSLILEE